MSDEFLETRIAVSDQILERLDAAFGENVEEAAMCLISLLAMVIISQASPANIEKALALTQETLARKVRLGPALRKAAGHA